VSKLPTALRRPPAMHQRYLYLRPGFTGYRGGVLTFNAGCSCTHGLLRADNLKMTPGRRWTTR